MSFYLQISTDISWRKCCCAGLSSGGVLSLIDGIVNNCDGLYDTTAPVRKGLDDNENNNQKLEREHESYHYSPGPRGLLVQLRQLPRLYGR